MPEDNHNDTDDQQRADRAPHPQEAPGANMGLLPPGTQPDYSLSLVDDGRAGAAGAPPPPPSYPVDLLGDSVLYERGNDPVRIAVMTNAQQTYGNRAVQRFLQRSAAGSVPVQRDDSNLPPTPDVTLPTPSLLQPVDLLKQYGLLGDFQYKLD